MLVEESIHVILYEFNNFFQERKSIDGDIGLDTYMRRLQIENRIPQKEKEVDPNEEISPLAIPFSQQVQGESSQELPKEWKFVINHPYDQIISNPFSGVRTRSSLRNICNNLVFISQIEPKNINDVLDDENWMIVIQKELNQFERSKVWKLIPKPSNQSVIGTRWVFINKIDENNIIIRNKVRLVAQRFNQEEEIDYEETFVLLARLEVLRTLFYIKWVWKKCFFFNEEVYVEQPPGFESFNFPNHVFKLKKTFYNLKQTLRAWYERLSKFILENGFKIGKIDTTLFIKTKDNDMLLVQIWCY